VAAVVGADSLCIKMTCQIALNAKTTERSCAEFVWMIYEQSISRVWLECSIAICNNVCS